MFERLEKITTEEERKKLQNLNILLIGVGGVGGYTLETLVRMGVEHITIVDDDTIEITNCNRRILATQSVLGKDKVEVAYNRAKDINPNIKIKAIKQNINKDTYLSLFKDQYDYVINACDTITTKILLIEYCILNGIKIISSMGTGNRFDPTKLEIATIWKTYNDPLAKIIRKLLKDRGIKSKIPVVFSHELPRKIKDRIPGSSALVPAVAGIYISSYIINDCIKQK